MKLLIAEDDRLFQQMLLQVLAPEFEVVVANDGTEAWKLLKAPDAPRLAILDWVMPGISGPEICRMVRADAQLQSAYLILLTSKNSEADIVAGLRAGADDYISKPPNVAELCARTRIGSRILSLQDALITASQHKKDERILQPKTAGGAERRRKQTARTEMVRLPASRWEDSPVVSEASSELIMESGIAANRVSLYGAEFRHVKG